MVFDRKRQKMTTQSLTASACLWATAADVLAKRNLADLGVKPSLTAGYHILGLKQVGWKHLHLRRNMGTSLASETRLHVNPRLLE